MKIVTLGQALAALGKLGAGYTTRDEMWAPEDQEALEYAMSHEPKVPTPVPTVRVLQDEIAKWANAIHPDRTPEEAIRKLTDEELPELLLEPMSETEYADVVILVLDIAYLCGIDVERAVIEKMAINRTRKWRIDPETGLLKHIKSGDGK